MNLLETIKIFICAFVVTVLLHILICRIASSKKFMLNGLIIGIITSAVVVGYFLKLERFDFIALYLFFTSWLLYLMVFINLLNSVTLKMLEKLRGEPKGFLYSYDFDFFVNNEDSLKTRLSSMELNGFIVLNDHSIHLTAKAQNLVRVILFLRYVFSINQVG